MGIGGVGMAGVAFLLKKAGHQVTGCDKYATPRTRWLEACGIPVAVGHSPDHLDGIDELVVTPAVPQTNPELATARGLSPQMRVRYRGEVLAEIVNASDGIAVCGTHGKTTTATFTTQLLQNLGASPSWCIGGETGTVPVAGLGTVPNVGTDPSKTGTDPNAGTVPIVVEADESDGTLALYHPRTLVLNAVDFDHLEHFSSKEEYFDCYRKVIEQTTETVIVCADHLQALALVKGVCPRNGVCPPERDCPQKVVTFGFAPDAQVNAADWPDIPVLGRHNVANALAAIAVALSRGFTREQIAAALPGAVSALPDRRFELVADSDDVRVYTDYAHHPRELECAVSMAASVKPRRLRVIFQPHRYSRTKALCNEFPPAFAKADEVVLVPVYPAFEEPIPGGDIADLDKAFRDFSAQDVKLARSAEEAWRHAFLSRESGDLVLIAGAGDVIQTIPLVKRDFTYPPAPHKYIFLGAGTNTWISDLATDEEYVRTEGTARLAGASLGIPWMAGIPGTIGGWIKMNAGAFGHSISEVVRQVKVDGKWIAAENCGFSYRHSDISGEIQDVEFDFAKAGLPLLAEDPHAYAADAAAFLAKRKNFPPGTKGSVFKNPPGDFAGRLLEAAGAKDLHVGGAYVWQEHANVIVAGPNATASDFLALARLMVRVVFFKFNVRLEPEVCGLAVW